MFIIKNINTNKNEFIYYELNKLKYKTKKITHQNILDVSNSIWIIFTNLS